MRIKFLKVCIFMFGIVSLPYLYGQDHDKMVDFLTNKFNAYVEAFPREEIFAHTDREDYIAGEYIWMKIYLVDRKSMMPTDRSRIAYVELLNSSNQPVVQSRFALYNGFGTGQLQLPDTLSQGIYFLRVYTNWMKNFIPFNFFLKEISIYNIADDLVFLRNTESEQNVKKRKINFSGSQDSASHLNLKIKRLDNNDLSIAFSAGSDFFEENGDLVYIFVQTHGNIDTIAPLKISGNKTETTIPGRVLTPGINQVTVFNSSGMPVTEKYNYTSSKNTGKFEVSIEGNLGTREKVTLSIKPADMASLALANASLSVSVAPAINSSDLRGIEDYLVCGTEFITLDHIINLNLIDRDTLMADSILQNITSNWIDWNKIMSGNIPDIVFRAENGEHFLAGKLEYEDQAISIHTEDVLLFTPGREPEFQHSEADSTGKFTFCLHIDEEVKDIIIMTDEVNYKSKILIESPFSGIYQSENNSVSGSEPSLSPLVEEMIVNYQVNRLYGVHQVGDIQKPVYLPQRAARFYGKPDIELNLSDYVALPNMEEIFFELLPRISLKQRDKDFKILIADRINENRFEVSPFLFLDGVKIRDALLIANLDPNEVERIDVVKRGYVIGDYFFPGILNVMTKKADFSSIQLPEYMIRFPYRVIDPSFIFNMPDYSSADQKDTSIPDFRNTLYWNPSVIPDKEGKIKLEFWTSDLSGSYEIIINGISSGGEIIYKKMTFTVE